MRPPGPQGLPGPQKTKITKQKKERPKKRNKFDDIEEPAALQAPYPPRAAPQEQGLGPGGKPRRVTPGRPPRSGPPGPPWSMEPRSPMRLLGAPCGPWALFVGFEPAHSDAWLNHRERDRTSVSAPSAMPIAVGWHVVHVTLVLQRWTWPGFSLRHGSARNAVLARPHRQRPTVAWSWRDHPAQRSAG